MHTRLASSGDLPTWAVVATIVLALVSLGALLGVELRRRERGGPSIVVSGVIAVAALVLAVVRPVRIAASESVVGAKVLVLADASRSMDLPGDDAPRREARDAAVRRIQSVAGDARLTTLAFGDGAPRPLSEGAAGSSEPRSDLAAALRALAASPEERPRAVVVVSDGRLDDPPSEATDESLRALADALRVPIHGVATTRRVPADASVRRVSTAGAAVAHVPLPLRVEVGCERLSCDSLTVSARELREDGPPAVLATGLAKVKDGRATVDLSITLERAGTRIVEVAVASPSGDELPDNDRRLLTLNVARERVRILHVAGRPTHDTRALRQWLKSNASADVVAFFILRTAADNPNARQEDLSLIPFPVDELFTEHLPSFDAIVLQDFDAQPYGLERHLPAVARYVRGGGGLIMVGGPNSFVAGGYAGTPLASVLPVELDGAPGATAADVAPFIPTWTDEGRGAPLLEPLRAVAGEELPSMPGSNVVGDVREGAIALWGHPQRKTRKGAPMPVLAIGDQGDGRSVALTVDGGWLLEFSELGARTAGRGHNALWDGLVGWLMRDPRFEPGQLEIVGGCVADVGALVRVRVPSTRKTGATPAPMTVEVRRLDADAPPVRAALTASSADVAEGRLPPLPAGGYTARLRVGTGPTTRRDFACERGGDEWADSRPDPDRLERLAKASGAKFSWATDDLRLPLPPPTVLSAERHVVPLAPAWVWALAAAVALGAHWIARRRGGLS